MSHDRSHARRENDPALAVPDPTRGETVESFVLLRPGAAVGADEIRAFCREQLAYDVPRQIEIVPELPKSSMMKILHRELRQRKIV